MWKFTLLVLAVGIGARNYGPAYRSRTWIRRHEVPVYKPWTWKRQHEVPVNKPRTWIRRYKPPACSRYRYQQEKNKDICNRDKCPEIANFMNGNATYEGMSVGQSATFSCDKNHNLCGVKNTVCKHDLKWSGPNSICVPFCFPGNFSFSYGSSKYFVSGFQLSYDESKKFCQDLNGTIVMINSREEQDLIRCVLDTLSYNEGLLDVCQNDRTYIWLGVVKTDGIWKFINGDNITEHFWGFNEPNNNDFCTDLHRRSSYDWYGHNGSCNSSFIRLHIICEMYADI